MPTGSQWPGEDTPLSMTIRVFSPTEVEFEFEYETYRLPVVVSLGQAHMIGDGAQEIERIIRERLTPADAADPPGPAPVVTG